MKTQPVWMEAVPDQERFPRLEEDKESSVAIIGGGITGILTAWQLSHRGIPCILLDKQNVATESTGHTTALISRSPDIVYRKAIETYGLERLTHFLEEMKLSQTFLRDLAHDLSIDCDWKDCRSYFYAREATSEMEQECIAIQSTGQAQRLDAASLGNAGFPISMGVVFDDEARFHPRKFLLGLLEKRSDHLQVFENSEVKDLKMNHGEIELRTKGATVHCQKLVLAGRTDFFKELHENFVKKKTYLIELEFPEGTPFSDDLFWDNNIPYYYFRRIDDRHILFGGNDTEESGDAVKADAIRSLYDYARSLWPNRSCHLLRGWQGTIFETADNLPLVGPHPAYSEQVFAAQGFAGAGMVGGTLASRLLTDLASGRQPPIIDFLGFDGRLAHQEAIAH